MIGYYIQSEAILGIVSIKSYFVFGEYVAIPVVIKAILFS